MLKQRNKEISGMIKITLQSSQQAVSMVGLESFQNGFDLATSDGRGFTPRTSASDWMHETSRDLDRLVAEQSSLASKSACWKPNVRPYDKRITAELSE